MHKLMIGVVGIASILATPAMAQGANEDKNMQGYVMALQCASAYYNVVPAEQRDSIPAEGASPFWHNLLKSLSVEVYRNWENDMRMISRMDFAETQVIGDVDFQATNTKIITYCKGIEEKVKAASRSKRPAS